MEFNFFSDPPTLGYFTSFRSADELRASYHPLHNPSEEPTCTDRRTINAQSLAITHWLSTNGEVTASNPTVEELSHLNSTDSVIDPHQSSRKARLASNLASPTSCLPSQENPSLTTVFKTPVCRPTAALVSSRHPECSFGSSDGGRSVSDEGFAAKSSPRKHKRPRLRSNPINPERAMVSSSCSHRTTRLPHTQVERRYREGLNREFERLRSAVPTLPQSVEADTMGRARPSKGVVLAAAIDYIRQIEDERDAAIGEVTRLRTSLNDPCYHSSGFASGAPHINSTGND